jgi:hypothetical protein
LVVVVSVSISGIGGVEGGEFGTDLVGIGVVEVVEDGEGLLPDVVGGVVVADGVVGVAEVCEGVGFVVAVTKVADQGEGVVVAGEGVCATRRSVISPAQPGGTRREVPGSDGLPRPETASGDSSMPGKQRSCSGV